jgi:hypothetical protein
MRTTTIGALLLLGSLTACGGSSTSDPGASGGAGGSGGSGASGGSSGSGGSAGTAGTTGGSAGVGGTGGQSCEDFLDQIPPPEGVTLRLVNATNQPIYLGGENNCGPNDLFQLQGPNGAIRLRAGGCGHTCEALQQHGDWCADACMLPPVVLIAPGGHYDTSWSGTTFEPFDMPESCYFEPQFAPPTCDRQLIAPAGDYLATSQAFGELLCTDVGICPCIPGPTGSCEIQYGATPTGESIAGKASFAFPSESLIELTFY